MKHLSLLLFFIPVFAGITFAQKSAPPNAENTVRNFIAWYNNNWKHLEEFETGTLNFPSDSIINEEDMPPYSINFKGVDTYLDHLRKTGFFSEKYLTRLKADFKEAEKNFKKYPQTDGLPEGFQMDRFFLTQDDFLDDVKNPDAIQFTNEKSTKTSTTIKAFLPACQMTLYYTLSKKTGDRWQIDKINTK